MGCCQSSTVDPIEDPEVAVPSQPEIGRGGESTLTNFSFFDLTMATKNFSPENIISEDGSDMVYKGRLLNGGLIAVKTYTIMAWPDPKHFVEEAEKVGKLGHQRVVNLIGYCCEDNERLLVAEFMPNDTLAKRLFYWRSQTMEWLTRLRVAYCVAEGLDYCNTAGFASYNNLSPYKVLFDEDGDACLSCFGLMKGIKDDQSTTGSVNPESVIFRFGTVLVNLLTGKQVPPSHAPEMIYGKNVIQLMDPNLMGIFSIEEATIVLQLGSRCLQYEDQENPNIKDIVATLETLQTITEVPSNEMLEMTNHAEVPSNEMLEMINHAEVSSTQLSSLGEACSRMDLLAIHKILMKAQYEDDKEVIESSFEEWIQEVKDLQEVREHGDKAFLEQDFKTAIECYSKFVLARRMVYPSVYARRSLSYLFCDDPDQALLDGMRAQEVFPDWPVAFYLQSVALAKLNMNTDSADILKEAAILEAKRSQK
ncbi:putative inactive receptor-like kinase BSK12 [Cardamine amara subsp. amara]|uniref:Serine/threonine-protein kinase BSK n=1 Tax=Cardamine amara subsp. amara TaxID=228776 RepID=A0ABD0Z1C0_CARAN